MPTSVVLRRRHNVVKIAIRRDYASPIAVIESRRMSPPRGSSKLKAEMARVDVLRRRRSVCACRHRQATVWARMASRRRRQNGRKTGLGRLMCGSFAGRQQDAPARHCRRELSLPTRVDRLSRTSVHRSVARCVRAAAEPLRLILSSRRRRLA